MADSAPVYAFDTSIPSLNLKTVQQRVDGYQKSQGLDSNGLRPIDPASKTLVTGIQLLVGIVMLGAWVVISYYFIKFWRNRRRTGSGSLPLKTSYGAWQGHNLGTSDLEPGDIARLKEELDKPKNK